MKCIEPLNNKLDTKLVAASRGAPGASLHPAWHAFLRFCEELGHGDIERLKIQDGLPVLAEVTKKKVRFPP